MKVSGNQLLASAISIVPGYVLIMVLGLLPALVLLAIYYTVLNTLGRDAVFPVFNALLAALVLIIALSAGGISTGL
jgi:hypothetical protein